MKMSRSQELCNLYKSVSQWLTLVIVAGRLQIAIKGLADYRVNRAALWDAGHVDSER